MIVSSNGSYKFCFLTKEGRKKLIEAFAQLDLANCSQATLIGITGQDARTVRKIYHQLKDAQNVDPVNGQTFETFSRGIQNYARSKEIPALETFDLEEEIDYQSRSTASFPSSEEEPKHDPSPPTESIYIERPPLEQICCTEIRKDRALLRIKAAQKMGKTMLINKILKFAEEECGYKTVYFDLEEPEISTINDLSCLLRYFVEEVSNELEISENIQEAWNEASSKLDSSETTQCRNYLEKNILKNLDTALVLGFDNVDRLFDEQLKEIAVNFFGMLRAWHNRGADIRKHKKVWKKVKMVIVYSTEKIPDFGIWESPFNVGLEKTLVGFDQSQVMDLFKGYQCYLNENDAKNLCSQLDGHPYLINLMLETLLTHPNKTLEELLEKADKDEGIYQQYFRRYWKNLQEKPDLAQALSKIVTSDSPNSIKLHIKYELESLGLVKMIGNEVKIRCEVYHRYFSSHLTTLEGMWRAELNENS